MKIAIIGAGFTGLSAGYQLLKKRHAVTIFEKEPEPGGLAIGYKEKSWDWTLEEHYHHWFTNDKFILGLAKELSYPVEIKTPKTSVFFDNEIFQLDSPLAILAFPKLPLIDKLRMATVLAFLKLNPFWKPLEKINANKFLTKTMGKRAYGTLWEPQLRNKMGKFADDVSLVWFWSRIAKRTPSLAYPRGGFLQFAKHLANAITRKGGIIHYNAQTISIHDEGGAFITYKTADGKEKTEMFDKVIVTLPSFLFLKLTPQLPQKYIDSLAKLRGLGATNMVLRLKEQFLKDNTYWLSICENNAPIMVIVEHTNFMNKKYYNNEHLVYIGNYPPADSQKFLMNKNDLLSYYNDFLKKINPDYKKNLIAYEVFKAPFAQPIVPTNYSQLIPSFDTPLPHVFLANIEQVYPWDRGTNYAVELGEKIANHIT